VSGGQIVSQARGIIEAAGRMNPAGRGMDAMTMLDNPGRAFNRGMEAMGAGNNRREGQSYTPAQMNPGGSITDGGFRSNGSGPSIPMSQ